MFRLSETIHVGSQTGSGSVQSHSGSRATQCPDPDEEPTHEPGDPEQDPDPYKIIPDPGQHCPDPDEPTH
jgi:hypothetical protein